MTETPDEQWKPIPSLSGYEASNQGRVRKGEQICRTYLDRSGGVVATINVNHTRSCRIARAVGEAFCPDFKPHLRPKFIDGDKTNCRASNLKWVSIREVSVAPSGERQGGSKLTWAEVDQIRASKLSMALLGVKYGVSKASIHDILRQKTWREHHRPVEALRAG